MATRSRLLGLLHDISTRAGRQTIGKDTVVLFFGMSAHRNGDIHLMLSDSRPNDLATQVSVKDDIAVHASARHQVLLITDACGSVESQGMSLNYENPYFTALISAKVDEAVFDDTGTGSQNSAFATALANAIAGSAADVDSDGLLSVEEVHHYVYSRVVEQTARHRVVQHPSLFGAFPHRFNLAVAQRGVAEFKLIDSGDFLIRNSPLVINGLGEYRASLSTNRQVTFLSDDAASKNPFRHGLNIVSNYKNNLLFWLEQKKLKRFQQPYEKSVAVIIAIDDYERSADPQLEPTGFEPLKTMVAQAKRLERVLVELGFDESNIISLYNADATSSRIAAELLELREGGRHEAADRVVVYFGGHGRIKNDNAWLITHDYDSRRPTSTAIELESFIEENARNIVAHHVLFAFDACHAGNVQQYLGGNDADSNGGQDEEFVRLANIRADVEPIARNVLFAGSGEQKAAVGEGDTLFTSELIAGLQGNADWDHDSVIRFDELAAYVRSNVIARSRSRGFQQEPDYRLLTRYGKGRVLFIRSPTEGRGM